LSGRLGGDGRGSSAGSYTSFDDAVEDLLDLRWSCAFAFRALRHWRARGYKEL
jgi:hypothetical protein